ncbi:MAG: hypothetical protein Crog4KO_01670 [Crocinitomicaceae bacterium]
MADKFRGVVTEVIDGDTFDIRLTEVLESNDYEYNQVERIRIAGIDAPEAETFDGIVAQTELESRIKGETVEITVEARDEYSRIVGTYEII